MHQRSVIAILRNVTTLLVRLSSQKKIHPHNILTLHFYILLCPVTCVRDAWIRIIPGNGEPVIYTDTLVAYEGKKRNARRKFCTKGSKMNNSTLGVLAMVAQKKLSNRNVLFGRTWEAKLFSKSTR